MAGWASAVSGDGVACAPVGADDLVEREVDLELDLLADEPAAGLEGDVPGQAPVLAVELRRGVEAGAPALEPSYDAEELDVERDGRVVSRIVRSPVTA